MRPRATIRPLEPARLPPPTRPIADASQLVADIRAHFPEFEVQLTREYPDIRLDVFATEQPAAVLFVLMRMTEQEAARRYRFIAWHLRPRPGAPQTDPDAELERSAIQSEGSDQRAEITRERRAGAEAPDHMAEPRGVPPEPPGS